MVVISALATHRGLVGNGPVIVALVLGVAITAYFHIVQAVRGIVNWAMPEPWRWNYLGAWHAAYMFAVCTLLSLFYVCRCLGIRAARSATRLATDRRHARNLRVRRTTAAGLRRCTLGRARPAAIARRFRRSPM